MSSSDILGYREMLADRTRTAAYRQAIHATVREGDVVADLGTGSGILAFFAVQAGAKKVYAIESQDIISVAEQLAVNNGMADRIVFIKGRFEQVDLPEPVDVIISELIGMFGLEENVLQCVAEFRDRFLKAGGALIPAWLDLYLTPVAAPSLWEVTAGVWSPDFYGLDFSGVRHEGISERYIVDGCGKTQRLAAETPLAHLDFYTVKDFSPTFTRQTPIEVAGVMHGYLGYFTLGLTSQVQLSTSPDDPVTHWKQSFFPLPEPVAVQTGDLLAYEATTLQMGMTYWKWNTKIIPQESAPLTFSQSNFRLSMDELRLNSSDYAPNLSKKGEIRRLVLGACDGHKTMADIANLLLEAYPDRFKDLIEANTAISEIVSEKLLT